MTDIKNPENCPKILFASGDNGLSASVAAALVQAGCLILEARDSLTAVSMSAAEEPDLVLLDAAVLGKECCDACREIRSLPGGSCLPILVVTGSGETELDMLAFEAGATDVIARPIAPGQLVWRMRCLLRDRSRMKSLEESARLLAGAQRIARLGNWEFDPETGVIQGSAEMFRILGSAGGEGRISFEEFLLSVQPSDRHMVASGLVHAFRRGAPCSLEFHVKRPDSSLRMVRLVCQANVTPPSGKPRMSGTLQDVTDMREVEEHLRMLKEAVDCLPIGITLTDVDGRIIYSNPAEAEIHGYSAEELVGRKASQFAPPSLRKPFSPEQLKALSVLRRESINIRKTGEEFPVQLTSIAVRNSEGRCTGVVTTCEDITAQKEADKRMHHLAYFDPLTGLPNREMFLDRLNQALALAHREKRKLCLVFLDLDNFKDVNDTQGHDFGDKLLREVSQRLTGTMRESDTLARFGGDEFVLLLTSVSSQESTATAAQRILSVFSHPFDIDGRQMYSSASVGLALFPDDGTDAESLFKGADTAMYHAKSEGKSRYHFFSEEMNRKIMRRVALENSLRLGMEREEFFLHYQPKWDLKTASMLGAEVLLRWRSPDFGLIQPTEFIALTESTGLIADLGQWVLRKACHQAKSWASAGHRRFKVAVNISGRQFRQPDFFDMVGDVVRETGIDPGALELEFTESVIMEQADRSVDTLESLRKMGVELSIDDFGTGYSSLNYLKNFPIDRINIDRSFVADVKRNNEAAALVEAIISMGHSLNLKVLAEGVENGDQLQFLSALGCDEVQGFYLAHPMTSGDLTRKMSGNGGTPLSSVSPAPGRESGPLVLWTAD